jgi:hypothetical protein
MEKMVTQMEWLSVDYSNPTGRRMTLDLHYL